MTPAFARRFLLFATFLAVCLGGSQAFLQNPPESAPPSVLMAENIVEYLTETIGWYRGTAIEQQIADEPGDIPYLNENRRISGAIVQLAFDFARKAERSKSVQPRRARRRSRQAGLRKASVWPRRRPEPTSRSNRRRRSSSRFAKRWRPPPGRTARPLKP